jgi:hypothetical protein
MGHRQDHCLLCGGVCHGRYCRSCYCSETSKAISRLYQSRKSWKRQRVKRVMEEVRGGD